MPMNLVRTGAGVGVGVVSGFLEANSISLGTNVISYGTIVEAVGAPPGFPPDATLIASCYPVRRRALCPPTSCFTSNRSTSFA